MADEIPQWVGELIHTGRHGQPANSSNCTGSVWEGRAFFPHQCTRKPTVQEYGHGWCRQHAPSAVKARRNSRNAKYAAESARKSVGYKIDAARRAITEKAIDAAHQRCSIDDVFAAVGEYERLVEEQRALIADHEARGLK